MLKAFYDSSGHTTAVAFFPPLERMFNSTKQPGVKQPELLKLLKAPLKDHVFPGGLLA